MSDEGKVEVAPGFVIDAQRRKLTEYQDREVMMEALLNQQAEQIADLSSALEELRSNQTEKAEAAEIAADAAGA